MEVGAGAEAGLALEDGLERVARRAGVRRRLEDDEMPGPQPAADLGGGVEHDREVGLALLRERRRQRDQDRVRVAEHVVVRRGGEAAVADEAPEELRRDVLDVALATVQLVDPRGVDLDEDDRAPGLREDLREGDADVARAHDRDVVRGGFLLGGSGGGVGRGHGAESYQAAVAL